MGAKKLEISAKELEIYDSLLALVQDATRKCFAQFSDHPAKIVAPIPDSVDINFDHWVCAINIKLDMASIDVKLHYSSGVARLLASKRFNIPAKSIPNKVLGDFIQEYLNLVMGQVKKKIGSADISVMVPETSPTRDMEDPRFEVLDRNSASWQLSWPDQSFFFSCMVKLEQELAEIDLQKLKTTDKVDEDDSGEMELF